MKTNIREVAVFGMLTAVIFALKKLMEILPNIHLVAVFIIAITVVYRQKALYPLYAYVFLDGLFGGFSPWWMSYLYVWTALWGATMLLPKNLSPKSRPVIYMSLCALHGFLFGVLCAPAQALFFHLDLKGTLAWIAAGLPFDLIHGISNYFCGILIVPIILVLQRVQKLTIS